MVQVLAFVTALLAVLARVTALHVYVGGNEEPKCFNLDLGKDALVSEKHSAWELEESTKKWVRDAKLAIEITIDELFDSNHRVYNHKTAPFSDFHFTALDGGEHRICYRALTDGWWTKSKVKLEIDYTITEGADIADTEGHRRLGSLADRVSELNRKFVHLNREQRLLRERESSFRDTSEKANSRVSRMTLIQIIVLAATCVWQVSHLKSFFVKQKLV